MSASSPDRPLRALWQRHRAYRGRFLLAVASVFQYLMGVSGVPVLLADVLEPLRSQHWLFLLATALITMMFGMVLEGLPAAVVLIPVVFPIAEKMGIQQNYLYRVLPGLQKEGLVRKEGRGWHPMEAA